jgi:DNA-binding transcriptional LysR family regulator
MTIAANSLGMTQSGVSQHISQLENDLGITLFIRKHKKLILTFEGELLATKFKKSFASITQGINELSTPTKTLRGVIRIGVPIEFGINIVIPIIAKISKSHPEIKFEIKYGLADSLLPLIEKGLLDFIFVDSIEKSSVLTYEDVYQEEIVLCCTKKYFNGIGKIQISKKSLPTFKFITYFDDARLVQEWFRKCYKLNNSKLNISITTKDAQGVFACIQNSMGFGVLPMHMFRKDKTDLVIIKPKFSNFKNTISLAYIKERLENPLLDFIYKSLKEKVPPKV